MTKLHKAIIAVLGVWVVSYLMAAFVLLDTNPVNWSQNARVAFCYIGIVFSWVLGGLPHVLFKDK